MEKYDDQIKKDDLIKSKNLKKGVVYTVVLCYSKRTEKEEKDD